MTSAAAETEVLVAAACSDAVGQVYTAVIQWPSLSKVASAKETASSNTLGVRSLLLLQYYY